MSRSVTPVCFIFIALTWGCELIDNFSDDDSDPYARPLEAREIASDELLERLIEYGFTIYAGFNPPSLDGHYYSEGGRTIFDSAQGGHGEHGTTCESYMSYTSSGYSYRYAMDMEYTECEGGSSQIWAYASGAGSCFTVYSKQRGEFHGCSYTSIGIRSGCVFAEGIVDSESAFLHPEQEGEACAELIENRRMPAPNEVRIVYTELLERVSRY